MSEAPLTPNQQALLDELLEEIRPDVTELVSEIGIEHVRELLRLAVYDRETLGRLLASLDDPITLH
jgi:hypothetical protein